LVKELNGKGCHLTGIIIVGRVGNLKPMKLGAFKRRKSGDISVYRKGNILVMG
jgi:hypothetical protein